MTGPKTGPGPDRRILNKGFGPGPGVAREDCMGDCIEDRGVPLVIITVGRAGGGD